MRLLRHPVAALVLFAMMVSLCVTIYVNLEDSYDLTETGTQSLSSDDVNFTSEHYNADGSPRSIMGHLEQLTIIQQIQNLQDNVERIIAPSNPLDLVGALMSSGLGVVKLIWGIFTFPIEIMNIVLLFYRVPAIIVTGINVMIFVYVAFIILSLYIKGDI